MCCSGSGGHQDSAPVSRVASFSRCPCDSPAQPQTPPPPTPGPPDWPGLHSWDPPGRAPSILPLPGSPQPSVNSGLSRLVVTPPARERTGKDRPAGFWNSLVRLGGSDECGQEAHRPHGAVPKSPRI